MPDEDSLNSILQPIIGPWYESLENPQKAQEQVLYDLLKKYCNHRLRKKSSRFRNRGNSCLPKKLPKNRLQRATALLGADKRRQLQALLPEPPECWVMTRGSTGRAKVLPATPTHLKQIFTCGARALINYALRQKNFEVFTGDILNLNFPSSVHTMTSDGREVTYGYSSGTYARLNPMFDRVSLIPRQEADRYAWFGNRQNRLGEKI